MDIRENDERESKNEIVGRIIVWFPMPKGFTREIRICTRDLSEWERANVSSL